MYWVHNLYGKKTIRFLPYFLRLETLGVWRIHKMVQKVIKFFVLLFLLLMHGFASAETVCSRVSIEILQELTLERIAFDTKMVITSQKYLKFKM